MFIGLGFYLSFILIDLCSSSILLERLRRQQSLVIQSGLSSSTNFEVNEHSKFRLTCSFQSNFDQIDIFWFHNNTLIQSLISKSIFAEEDDIVENSFLAVTIRSTIEVEETHLDMNGVYQCVAMHQERMAEQTFNVRVIPNESEFSSRGSPSLDDALITVHTYQSLFEPRPSTSLMCRVSDNRKDKCTVRWFNPDDEPLMAMSGGETTDLVLKNANFDEHMGLYNCEVCCENRCQRLTSFVYPAGRDD